MRKLFPLFLVPAFLALLVAFLLGPVHNSPAAASEAMSDGPVDGPGGPSIRSTELISIPYGIGATLSLLDNGEGVLVSGHGGCTAGETVTIVISVTQPYGATAVGQKDQTCTGERQTWWLRAETTTMAQLTAGPAEACGLATARDAEGVTGTDDWCRPDGATLAWFTYLPTVVQDEGTKIRK